MAENIEKKPEVTIIPLPTDLGYTDENSYVRFISPGRGSSVKYELRIPKPITLDDEGIGAVCGKTLADIVRLGLTQLGHSADDVARLEMLVLGEDQIYAHSDNYTVEKHIAMQTAFVGALKGENRRVREPKANIQTKVAKAKREGADEMIQRLIAAGKLPEGFTLD